MVAHDAPIDEVLHEAGHLAVMPWILRHMGEGENVCIGLSRNSHPGVVGLFHGGMIESKKSFPIMKRWVQP